MEVWRQKNDCYKIIQYVLEEPGFLHIFNVYLHSKLPLFYSKMVF